MNPNENEIQEAKDLQRLGLCQGAKEWVWEFDNTEFSKKNYEIRHKESYANDSPFKLVGPLPTANEVWPEIDKALSGTSLILIFSSESCLEIEDCSNEGIPKTVWSMFFKDLDSAMRQALIALKQV